MGIDTNLQILREVPLFAGLSDEHWANYTSWLAGRSKQVRLETGDTLYREGDAAHNFYILVEGELQTTKRLDEQEIVLARHRAGEFTGEMPLLFGTTYQETARATQPSLLLGFQVDDVRLNMDPVGAALLASAMQRITMMDQALSHREKLAALGKLSAGLAHELNNPASAGRRAAAQLRQSIQTAATTMWDLNQLSPEQRKTLSDLQCDLLNRSTLSGGLNPVALSDLEKTLEMWLNDHGIADAWNLSPTMAAAGVDTAWLDRVANQMGTELFGTLIPWIESTISTTTMLDEIETSTTRISELIDALKAYTYMDQAPLIDVNIHEGLESTLVILRHRLKDGIEFVRDYDMALPRIDAYGSELNQVWTNLIDNAIDAMHGHGKLWLRTRADHDHVIVEIADNGEGIAPEHLSHIFEPFFTTKGVGEGSGMGLDISYRTVVHMHHGDIQVRSKPGDTCFQVRLPVHQPERT